MNIRTVPTEEFRGDKVRDARFVGESYVHHRYFGRSITKCQFVECRFEDLRIWDTHVSDSAFLRCDLRGAALGGILDGRVNRFERVTFEKTDLRRTAWQSAEFSDCRFIDCRMDGVDFQGARFASCAFVGELREVLFYDRGFNAQSQPPNELRDCDFSKARLETTEFRRLDLATIVPPQAEASVTIYDYRRFLDAGIRCAKAEEKVFVAMLKHRLKWIGAHQNIGFFGHGEILELLGPT